PGSFPDGSRYLRNTAADCSRTARTNGHPETDYGTSNFQCNPSRIDGVSIVNSSHVGGALFEHGWNHNLEIANTRIHGTHGTRSGTPSAAGVITISAGADNYTIAHNWIAGNLSSGDGAGMVHAGVTFNGTIANNWILFNQSVNPTLPTNGGGLTIAGANNDRVL